MQGRVLLGKLREDGGPESVLDDIGGAARVISVLIT
jgi:hypothetical protein